MELYGTHGTSKSRTTIISKAGFVPGTRISKVGKGVYFWAYEQSKDVAIEMARNWWSFASSKGLYKSDTDKRRSIIDASLIVDDDNYLDCNDLFFLEHLYKTAQ